MHKKILKLGLLLLILGMFLAPGVNTLLLIPSEVTQFEGEEHPLDFDLPWGIRIIDKNGILKLADEVGGGFVLRAERAGNYRFSFNLLGLIPLKQMQVNVIPPLRLAPSGHSIGVRLSERGVIIAGLDSVQTSSGPAEPARDSGFKVGDILVAVNDIPLENLEHAAAVLEEQCRLGQELRCEVIRGGKSRVLKIVPVYDQLLNRNRLGLLLKDTVAGVGTMTFYHPETKIFGALGHMITDESGKHAVELSAGSIVSAEIVDIQPGQRGKPGEKKGAFAQDEPLGHIASNTDLGIFGKLYQFPPGEVQTIPLGFKHQVRTGPAEILTVIEGTKVERFSIEIEKLFVQKSPASKGMIIRITDPRLLAVTGGIVQGMSGSPIIQDGKLVGAITHVFINEPQRGYGCFAEWMVIESGLLDEINSAVPPEIWEAFFKSVSFQRRDYDEYVEIIEL